MEDVDRLVGTAEGHGLLDFRLIVPTEIALGVKKMETSATCAYNNDRRKSLSLTPNGTC